MTAIVLLALLCVSILGYFLNRQAATKLRANGTRLHSVPGYHGLYSLLSTIVPVVVLIVLWLIFQGPLIDRFTMSGLPAGSLDELDTGGRQLILAEIKSISRGRIFGNPEVWKVDAADRYVWMHAVAG